MFWYLALFEQTSIKIAWDPICAKHEAESMNTPDFYMRSSDVYEWDDAARVRQCWRVREVVCGDRHGCLLTHIDPPLRMEGSVFGSRNLSSVILATRHIGTSLFPISEWPLHVHVLQSDIDNLEKRDQFAVGEFKSILWCELYRSEADAYYPKTPPPEEIRFIGERIGQFESDVKVRITTLLSKYPGVRRAYLAEVNSKAFRYNHSALCIMSEGISPLDLDYEIGKILSPMVSATHRVDHVIHLDTVQEARLAAVCKPFMGNPV